MTVDTRPPNFRHSASRYGHVILLGTLLVIAAFVFFVLPEMVSPPDAPPSLPTVESTKSEQSDASRERLSPSERIRRQRYRREAQELLSEAVDLQLAMESKKANLWASSEFDAAVNLITSGDEAFADERYDQAQDYYSTAVEAFEQLDGNAELIADRLLAEALTELEQNRLEAVRAKVDLALLTGARQQQAKKILQRAEARPAALEMLEQAQAAAADETWAEARRFYQETLRIDNDYPIALEGLRVVNEKITNIRFSDAMSAGLLALQRDDFDSAYRDFQKAAALKPGDPAPASAIEKLRARRDLLRIQALEKEAERAVAEERWEDAVSWFDQILKVNAEVLSAQHGKEVAANRHEIDKKLVEILADPKELGNERYRQNTTKFYETISGAGLPGERLERQLTRLEEILALAALPISVRFTSDGLTSVEIDRVGEFGRFERHEVDLPPGRYTVRGIRNGYQDVIKPLELEPGATLEPIDIRCRNKL